MGDRPFRDTRLVLTFGNDGRPNTTAKIVRKFVKLVIPINFDGALRGVAKNIAVVAPLQVLLEFGPGTCVQVVVEIVGELFQKIRAFHVVYLHRVV